MNPGEQLSCGDVGNEGPDQRLDRGEQLPRRRGFIQRAHSLPQPRGQPPATCGQTGTQPFEADNFEEDQVWGGLIKGLECGPALPDGDHLVASAREDGG